jgi:hypothetical protein
VAARRRALAVTLALAALVGSCGDDDDGGATRSASSTTAAEDVAHAVRRDLGALHRSTIREVPGLVALFYHDPDGWAVEDTSFDEGATWCRHAWYRWELTDVVADDDFTVRYSPTAENPACAPLGEALVLHVTSRRTRDGRSVLTGEYVNAGLHAERTVCPGTIDDFADVCGESSGLGAPTEGP